jgi:hypothetical protein
MLKKSFHGFLTRHFLRYAPALRFPCFAWVPARALLARAFAGTTVHWTVVCFRLTLLRPTISPGAKLDRRRRPAGCTPGMAGIKARGLPSCATPLRFALPAALGHRPKPSVAWAFGGTKVHRTFAFCRLTHLTHWTVVCFRLTHRTVVFSRLTHWTLALFRLTPRSFVCIRFTPAASLCGPIALPAQLVSSQSNKRGFCFAPFIKHLRI